MRDLLHRECLGRGADLVLLHGWGMSGVFMRSFAELLAERFRVTVFDLPGHGLSPWGGPMNLEAICDALMWSAPPRAHWVGWSLGAEVALLAADRYPHRVESVSLIAGTPRFVSAPDWPGVDAAVLQRFAADLSRDYQRTIDRFIALQIHGTDQERRLLLALRDAVSRQQRPTDQALKVCLRILEQTDLRSVCERLSLPLFAIFGGRDRLVPATASDALKGINASVETRILAQAAHLPFWTHPRETSELLCSLVPHAISGQ